MPDRLSPNQRYRAMANNRGRTRPERDLASGLWSHGLRYLTHQGYRLITGRRLTGQPDLVFPRKRVVIFVDGCFWHGCSVCNKSAKETDRFWIEKISANRKRDQRTSASLTSEGWTVLRVPEHDLRPESALKCTLARLIPWLLNQPGQHRLDPDVAVWLR